MGGCRINTLCLCLSLGPSIQCAIQLPSLVRKANCVHKQCQSLVEDVMMVVVVVVVSSLALYSVPSFPLSMYINTDDVCHRRKQKTEGSGPRLRSPQSFGVEVDY